MTDTTQRPFSIKMFVATGDPDGLRLVEKSNWTGVGVVFNRTAYKEAAARDEFDKTGVYILVGRTEDSSLPTVYIGEGDPVRDRLSMHYAKKNFWDWAVFFVAKDGSLNKAHVKYLEHRLIVLVKDAKKAKLDNLKDSNPSALSEADKADCDSFLADVLSIFPLLGLSVFEKTESGKKPENLLFLKAKGITATGYEDAQGFIVLKDSQMVKDEATSIHAYLTTIRRDLIGQQIVADQGGSFVFVRNYVFNSPSTASGVILGRTSNGRVEWKSESGRTLKEIQAELANQDGDEE